MPPREEVESAATPQPTSPPQGSAGAFDWTQAHFIPSSIAHRIPGWLVVVLHTAAILVLLGTPLVVALVVIRNTTDKYYGLFADSPPKNPNFWMELIRWFIMAASAYVSYGLTLLAISIGMWLLNRASSKVVDRDEPPHRVGQLITGVMGLRTNIALAVSALVLTLMAFLLFPLSVDEKERLELLRVGKEKGPEAAATLVQASLSLQYAVTRACTSILIATILVLLEKVIVQRIAVLFHYHSAAARITDNNFQLKMTRKLKRALVDTRRLSTAKAQEADPSTVGALLFDAICPTGEDAISAKDLQGYLPANDVDRYFSMLDPEAHGDLRRSELALAVKHFFEERDDLTRTVTDQTRIVYKVDRLLLVFVSFAIVAAAMFVFNVPFTTALATIGSASVALTVVFSSAARTAFESIVFVIFTHPFDVGDKVMIKNDFYVVKELGLWSSTFYGPGRRITYITNSVLRSQMIVNVRRSPLQNEGITIKILPSTPQERLQALEAKLNDFLRANSRDYVPPLMLKGYRFIDKDHMAMEMLLQHRSNFQNGELKDARTKNFMLFLKEAVAECGIEFAPSY